MTRSMKQASLAAFLGLVVGGWLLPGCDEPWARQLGLDKLPKPDFEALPKVTLPEPEQLNPAQLAPWQLYVEEPFAPRRPDSPPDLKTLGTEEVRVRACRGQTAVASFTLWARTRLRSVSVYAEDMLHGSRSDQVITSDRVDVRIVKWWEQAGKPDDLNRGAPTTVPELLLKDDAEPLTPPLPDVRLRGVPVTDVAAGRSKQFWVTIDVPRYAEYGTYRGRLLVKPAGRRGRYITIVLIVPEFDLAPAEKIYCLFHHRRATGSPPETLALELEDMRRHGITSVACYDGPATIVQALRLRYEMGLRGPTPILSAPSADHVRRIESICRQNAWMSLWWYGVDAPQDSPEHYEANVKRFRMIHEGGGKTVVVTPRHYIERLGDLLDVACPSVVGAGHGQRWAPYDLSTSIYIARVRGGHTTTHAYRLYHWHPVLEDPRVNRLLAGYFLHFSKFDGVFPYVYVRADNRTAFDEVSGSSMVRTPNLAYPSVRGPIGTIQWEAFREGIYDLRYVRTLEQLVETMRREYGQAAATTQAASGPEPADTRGKLLRAVAKGRVILGDLARRIGPDYYTTYQRMKAKDFSQLRLAILYQCREIVRLRQELADEAEQAVPGPT